MAERTTKRWLLLAGLGLSGLVAASGLLQLAEPATVSLPAEAAASAAPTPPIAASRPVDPPRQVVLRPGQTLGEAMAQLGLESNESLTVTQELSRYLDPRRLRPGDVYKAHLDGERKVAAVEVALEGKGEVRVQRANLVWRSSFRPVQRETRLRAVRGTIENGLESAVRTAGADPELAYRMADVLQWDIDFNRDLRTGDRFEVLFEEIFLDGVRRSVGEVIALAYTNGGRRIEGYRYEGRGYFDAEGQPLQKMFLRSPMKYSRVTSRFSMRRFHPVLKVYRPHYGIDYGAPSGTPAYVTANGVVSFMGWDGGGGRTVKVRHPNGYVSNYLHLSRFPSGVGVGSRVRQGDVIGYVGSTGLATASHLDYRVQWNGRWIDPLKIANVRAEALSRADLPGFGQWIAAVRAGLTAGEVPALLRQGTTSSAVTVLASAPGVVGSASSVSARR